MSNQEIYAAYLENLEARTSAGFAMPGSLAVEDTAYLLDLSIKDVCVAISVCK